MLEKSIHYFWKVSHKDYITEQGGELAVAVQLSALGDLWNYKYIAFSTSKLWCLKKTAQYLSDPFFFFCGTCDSSRIKLISLIAEAMTLYNISEYVCVAGQTGWKCVQPWARWYILSAGQRTERITET